jgi:hypothetical protein
VAYFEVGNEWSMHLTPEEFLKILHPTIAVIKKTDPEARLMFGAPHPQPGGEDGIYEEMILPCLRSGNPNIASQIHAIGYHPFYQGDPESKKFRNYPKDFLRFKKECEALGFKGVFAANEWAWMAPYPPTIPHEGFNANKWTSEMQKAKYAAQFMTLNSGLGIISLWNETFMTNRMENDTTLFRLSSFQVDPITPAQPQAVYYVLRSIGTVLDGFEPADFKVTFSGRKTFDCYTFLNADGDLIIAPWIPGKTQDGIVESTSDIKLPGLEAKKAWVYDVFNGTEQELVFSLVDANTVLKGMRVKDYPTFIRLQM